eukprot:4286646-Alexandrium_andersonii.AAC.1
MPTASNHEPNSRKGPGGTPARIRAGNSRGARCSRTARDASTVSAAWRSSGFAPMPLPIPKAAAGPGGPGAAATASTGSDKAGG